MERSRRDFIIKALPALAFGPFIACRSAETLIQSAEKTSTATVPNQTHTLEITPTPTIEIKPTSPSSIEHPPPPMLTPTATPEQTRIPSPSTPVRTEATQPAIVPESKPSLPIYEISRGNLQRPEIALTFDCGASSEPTSAILEALRSEGVRVTFFITGKWALNNPELTRQISIDHEIANHSFSHHDFSTLTNAQIIEEMQKTERIITEITGKSTKPFWRAPFGSRDTRIMTAVSQAGWPNHIFWTIEQTNQSYITGDSGDWKDITPVQVKQNILTAASLGNGVITVSHCGSNLTPLILSETIKELKANGLKITTVSEILRP